MNSMTAAAAGMAESNSKKKKRAAASASVAVAGADEEEDRISPTSTVVTAASLSFNPNNSNATTAATATSSSAAAASVLSHQQPPTAEEEAAVEPEEEDEEEEVHQHLLGNISTSDTSTCKIVGIQYYRGVAHPGEYVSLVREPRNPYDSNAIRVDNMSGEKVGHVKRQLAAHLAPIIDRYIDSNNNNSTEQQQQQLTIDASIPYKGSRYDLPLSLEFRGPDISLASTIDAALPKRFKYKNALKPASKKKSAAAAVAAAAAPKVQVQTKKLDWKAQQKQLDDMFQAQTKAQLENLPQIEMPSQLQLQLLPHQIDGVRWLVQRERQSTSTTTSATTTIPFYKQVNENGKTKWFCEITNASQDYMPLPVKGGILCDDMGLGKTVQAIALVLSNPPVGRDYSIPFTNTTSTISSGTASIDDEEEAISYKKPTKTAVKKLKLPLLHSILIAVGININNLHNNKKEKLVAAVMDGIESGAITLPLYYKAIAKPPPPSSTSSSVSSQPKTTLIVCPVSVMGNWHEQIESHVSPGTLRVALYHGTDRKDNLYGLEQIDILIASYNTLQYDYNNDLCKAADGGKTTSEPATKKFKGTSIFNAQFHRVILDEGHIIRNTKSKTFQACKMLKAERRTCLTGTPIQNKPEDIHSLFSFLNAPPFFDKDVFRRAIGQPIKDGDDSGLAHLRAMMAHIALRRNKSTAQIELVEKSVELRIVQFPADSKHKSIHDTIYESAKFAFQATMQGGNESTLSHTSVFEILLRLRQACCSGKLVPLDRLQRAEQVLAAIKNKKDTLTAEEGKELLDKLKGILEYGDAPPECAICLDQMQQDAAVVLRACGHVFCQPCIAKVATGYHSNCPFCRHAFKEEDMIKWGAAAAASASGEACPEVKLSDQVDQLGPSPKLEALLAAIGEMRDGEKGVIFSQFTKFLDEIENFLDANDFSFARIDGKKTATQRIKAMQEFGKEHGGPRFMLCSLHAAGVGLNLTRGNFVFMCDTWWNSAVEKQAMDRVHRIGQRRKVRVVRFVAADSVESRMVSLQEAKECQAKGAFESLSNEEKRKARLSDVKKLLEL